MFNLQAAHRDTMCFASNFVNAFAEKIDSRQTSPILRVHTNTAKHIHGKAPAVVETLLTVAGPPLKAKSVAFAMENRAQSLLFFVVVHNHWY